ncbi:hypothetical protein CASFOL_008017 [Castilleja foliolosa]|uniref:Uncharacterized protein n=1 Tax=Castilleja foliolosa TaxID=1961234 RepID=A0ABD3E1Y9_9LAMI
MAKNRNKKRKIGTEMAAANVTSADHTPKDGSEAMDKSETVASSGSVGGLLSGWESQWTKPKYVEKSQVYSENRLKKKVRDYGHAIHIGGSKSAIELSKDRALYQARLVEDTASSHCPADAGYDVAKTKKGVFGIGSTGSFFSAQQVDEMREELRTELWAEMQLKIDKLVARRFADSEIRKMQEEMIRKMQEEMQQMVALIRQHVSGLPQPPPNPNP